MSGFLGANQGGFLGVTRVGGGGAPSSGTLLDSFDFYGDQVQVPNNADWPVTAIAPTAPSGTDASISIVAYDDTTPEGRGGILPVPGSAIYGANAASVVLQIISQARTAPGAARTVGVRLYYRVIPNNAAVGAWLSLDLNDIDIPTNSNFQYDTQTLVIGGGAGQLNVTPGLDMQYELVRIAPSAGVNLVGDWDVAKGSKFAWLA